MNVDIKELAILAGIGTSLDFLVPVGTPPSAIAYSSGHISVADMLRAGIFITIAGILLMALLAWLYW
jgi:sodium-dependent dicarboxylate transporter 2/3/5